MKSNNIKHNHNDIYIKNTMPFELPNESNNSNTKTSVLKLLIKNIQYRIK